MRRAGALVGVVFVIILVLFVANRDVRRDENPGDPVITVDFPATAEPGSIQAATFTISNPGPGDMGSLFLAFVRVGPSQGGSELPFPIVDPGRDKVNPNIVSIEPEPEAISPDAVQFRFGSLEQGEQLTVTFELRIPEVTGEVANSVTAYAGEDPSRASGVRLSTQVI
ncbi:MAG TPA: hypothetical protein VG408_07395 [Actinomycetota bacterium]|nr:hypothetical protein [Actinomycetota bacterium]